MIKIMGATVLGGAMMYRDSDSPAHPGLYLDQANRALDRNVRVSPWIHGESQGQHLSVPRVHERLETRAKVKKLFTEFVTRVEIGRHLAANLADDVSKDVPAPVREGIIRAIAEGAWPEVRTEDRWCH